MSIPLTSKEEVNATNLILKTSNISFNNQTEYTRIEEKYPDTIEEIKNLEKQEIEKQEKLLEMIKDTENKLLIEKKRGEEIELAKELEISKKKKELYELEENNKRLKLNFNKLQVETNIKLDKIEKKEKNELDEKENEKRQQSLDVLLKVKEKEILNSLQIVNQKKKKKSNLEQIMEKYVDMPQINSLYDKIKLYKGEIKKLKIEKENLEKIRDEHNNCPKNEKNIIKEIENIKQELKIIQMKNRDKINEERRNIYLDWFKPDEQKYRPQFLRKNLYLNKSNELPPIFRNFNTLNRNYQENNDRAFNRYKIDDYLKKIEDIEKGEKIEDKMHNNKIKRNNKEKEELEMKYNNYSQIVQEDENKNKYLISQIEDQRNDINELQEKMKALLKRVEAKRKMFEEKETKNLDYIQNIKDKKFDYKINDKSNNKIAINEQ